MKIIEDLRIEVPDTNAHHWDLKSHSKEDGDTVLFYGYNVASNRKLQDKFAHYKRRIYFNNWAPCEYAQPSVDDDAYFSEIYSICPYTSKWINQEEGASRYRPIFYPYNKKIIPETHDKKYDVIYHGGIHGQEHVECINTIRAFNYRYCTMDHHINLHTQAMLPLATNINLNFQQKVNLVAQSKVSVCYNLVHVNSEHVPNIKSHSKWDKNIAFSEVGKWNVMPQFKTRIHEAAISKTLNLVLRDKWNIIEEYYKPEKEFVYFDNALDLKDKIADAVNHWERYQEITENAFKKAQSYQIENFLDKIENHEM